MSRANTVIKLICLASALAVLGAASAFFSSVPVGTRPLGETAQMRLLPDAGPVFVTVRGQEAGEPSAEQLPSCGFDAAMMPVYDTGKPVDLAKLPVCFPAEREAGACRPFAG